MILGGEVGSSVRISREHGDGKCEGYPLVNVIGVCFRSGGGSFDGILIGEYY